MDPKSHTTKPPPPVPRSKSVSSSSSQFHSHQRFSSIHGGRGLSPTRGHTATTVVPSGASKKPMSPQRANHGNITEAVYDSPELCAGHTSDEIHARSNPSYAEVSMLPTGIEIHTQSNPSYAEVSMQPTGVATTIGEMSYSESLSLQQIVQKHSKSLPARVKVLQGYYGQNVELIADEIYNVHFVKHQKVVTIKDTQGTVYSVPLASTLHFGLVFTQQESMDGTTFPKASDIMALKVLPKVVCATKAFLGEDEESSVQESEILKIQSVEIHGTEVLEVFSFTTNSVKVLQANCEGNFSTNPSLIRLHLPDILTCLPCKAVMFIDETVTPQATAKKFPSSILSGPILIAESKVETSLVASLSSKTPAHKDSGKVTLLDIPLKDYLAEVEVAVLMSPSTEEVQLLCNDTKRIIREFHPNKLKYLREMKSARATRLQSLLYAEVQKGQEMVGVELESSIVYQTPLPIPSPTLNPVKPTPKEKEKSPPAEAFLPSKESEAQHVYESLPGESELGPRHFQQARKLTSLSEQPKQQPSGSSTTDAPKKPSQPSTSQYEALEDVYPQRKPKVPPKGIVGLKPPPKPAPAVKKKPEVSAKPTSKLGDDYVHFHTPAEPLQARVSLLESQSKKHDKAIQHLDEMRSTLEQVMKKLQSLDSQVQKLNLESAPMKNSSSSTSPKEENKQYLQSLDNTQVRKC